MRMIPLILGGRGIGEVRLDGATCTAECRMLDDGLYRAYLRGSGGTLLIGVLAPCGACLRAQRRLTAAERTAAERSTEAFAVQSFPFSEEAWTPLAGGAFFAEAALDRALAGAADALVRREADGTRLLALPYAPDAPFPLPELFCFARIRTVRGRPCVVYRADAQGHPIF